MSLDALSLVCDGNSPKQCISKTKFATVHIYLSRFNQNGHSPLLSWFALAIYLCSPFLDVSSYFSSAPMSYSLCKNYLMVDCMQVHCYYYKSGMIFYCNYICFYCNICGFIRTPFILLSLFMVRGHKVPTVWAMANSRKDPFGSHESLNDFVSICYEKIEVGLDSMIPICTA